MFFKLLEVSDVVLENFRPGTMEKMGFSYEKMCEVNPGIILASVSGFGQYGPYRDRQCFDPIIQAMSGIGHQTGRGFDQPVMSEGPIMDRPCRFARYHRDPGSSALPGAPQGTANGWK
ncbi:MAG: hypothetical protein Ct9H300mP11_23590 [Chloroflexota bacterium]|nr:MAG: hypothetical protein Ct9H300mP11_23590 [Chloroflexota bacterium]